MTGACRKLHVTSRTILHSRAQQVSVYSDGMDLRVRIQALIDRDPELTYRKVSLAAGLSDSMLHKFMTGQTKSMTVENLEAIAGALGVSLRHLMFGSPDDEKVAYIWDRISDNRRKQALQVLETFADEPDGTNG